MRRATCGNIIGRSSAATSAGLSSFVGGHTTTTNTTSPAPLANTAISRRFNASAASPQRAATTITGKNANSGGTAVPATKAMVTVVGAIHDLSQGFVTMKGPNREISPTRSSASSTVTPLAGSAASQRSQESQESVLQFVVTTNQLGEGSLLENTPALPAPETSPTESFPPPAAMSVTSFRDACIRKEQFIVRCFGDEEDLSALRLCLLDGSVVRVRGALRLNKQDKELASLPAGAVAGGGVGSGSQNPAARGGLYGRRGNTPSSATTPTPTTPASATATSAAAQSGGQDGGSILKRMLGIDASATPTTTTTPTSAQEGLPAAAVPPQVQAPGGGDEMRYFPYLHVQLPSTKAVEKEEGAALRPLGELTVLHRRP